MNIASDDTEFVLGSAIPHRHSLVLGRYSVHTSPKPLRRARRKFKPSVADLSSKVGCRPHFDRAAFRDCDGD